MHAGRGVSSDESGFLHPCSEFPSVSEDQRNQVRVSRDLFVEAKPVSEAHGQLRTASLQNASLKGESCKRPASVAVAEMGKEFMKLLVPRITDATTRKDLREFANRVIESWFRLPFSERPRIVSCRILSISDSIGIEQRHGLLDVTPDDAAIKIIQKLNGALLRGKRVGVKRYDAAAAR